MCVSCPTLWPSSTMIFLVQWFSIPLPSSMRLGMAGVRISSACRTTALASWAWAFSKLWNTCTGTSTHWSTCSTTSLTCSTKHFTCSKKHLTCSTKHLICSMKHLTYSTKHLTSSTKHLTCSTKHLTCSTNILPAVQCVCEWQTWRWCGPAAGVHGTWWPDPRSSWTAGTARQTSSGDAACSLVSCVQDQTVYPLGSCLGFSDYEYRSLCLSTFSLKAETHFIA